MDTASTASSAWDNSLYPSDEEDVDLDAPNSDEEDGDVSNSNSEEIFISDEEDLDVDASTSKAVYYISDGESVDVDANFKPPSPSRKRSMETDAQGSPETKRPSTPHPSLGFLNPSEDIRMWVEQTQSEIISGVTPVNVSLVLLCISLINNVIYFSCKVCPTR